MQVVVRLRIVEVRVANDFAKRDNDVCVHPVSIVCNCGMDLENQIQETRVEFGERTVRVSN